MAKGGSLLGSQMQISRMLTGMKFSGGRRNAATTQSLTEVDQWVESPLQGNLHGGFGGGCALQAHTVQPSGMAALIKHSQPSGTKSCVVYGNVLDEA